ncbi:MULTISPECIES: hypothetical protein [Bacillus cereus group]|uniref:Uncharacterized protein n=3 Tax=Bacillus TaxID=1386 RepID=A0A2C1D8D0_BACCE|nr:MULTISPECIES: hypothetical protein [Bacillus cereus group]OFD69951.1 hypothetical protein BWGOE8_58740 [Bacillus mycoides]OFD69962.1 hypothetical protein BWGOE9_57980 [Bacillus mycoides]OFD70588.1 hypothetical protein BWGOE10_57790 [Bacillus mycoides]PGT02595.1 hypothetical protein COD09_11690 [Bacillus cereus]
MNQKQIKELPTSVQHVLKVMRGEESLKQRQAIKPVDFHSYTAEEIFPNSPEMQRYFNKQKKLKTI